MPTYVYPPAAPQYYTRPRAYSASYGAYPQPVPVVYTAPPIHHSHGSHGSHGRSHSHQGRRSHSHSRHHSGHHDGKRHHHHSSSHHGHGYPTTSPGYTYGNVHHSTGHYPQASRVDSRHSHNVLVSRATNSIPYLITYLPTFATLQYNPHHSQHSRRYSESGFSLGDRIRNFFTFGASSRSPRSGEYIDARTGRKVDHRGRQIYRV